MPADTDQPTLAVLANATLQPGQPPKDRVFYARHHVALKWTPYKPNSQEVKRGKMGRWQELRPYGIGWQNSEVEPEAGAWVEDVLNNPERDTRTNSEPRPAGDLREALARVFCAFDNDGVASASVPQNAAFFAHWLAEDPQYYEAADAALHLIATHSPAPMAGWQDMSDAPRDGSHILAWFWSALVTGNSYGWADTIRWWNGMWWDDRDGPCEPVAWMPRPAPPAAAHPSTREGGDRG